MLRERRQDVASAGISTARTRGVRTTGTGVSRSREQEKKKLSLPSFRSRVKIADIGVYSRGFATMVGAGVPLAQCLDILSRQTENQTLSKATVEIKAEVEGGGSLSDALSKYPKIFSDLYTNMVKAGEASGALEIVLNQLADLLEQQRDLQNKVKSALFLPVMVLGFCLLMTTGLIVFVVPKFAAIFEEMNAELPGPTQALVDLSKNMRSLKGLIVFGTIILLILVFRKIIKTEKGGYAWDQIKLKLPLFGPLILKKVVASFARIFGLLEHAGVSILESLDIVADTAGNRVIARAIREARNSIQQGESLSKPLEESQVFPPMVTQMIVVGEETGTVETMLNKIAELYEAEVERAVEGLTKLIEPMMMILVGTLVGTILICLYLPIFNMAGAISGGV